MKSSNGRRHGGSIVAGIHCRFDGLGAGHRGIRQARAGRPSVGRTAAHADVVAADHFRAAAAARHVMCRKSLPHLLEHVLRLGHEGVDVAEEEFVVGFASSIVIVVVAVRAVDGGVV